MSTWYWVSTRIDPWSYRALKRRQADLAERNAKAGKPPPNQSQALRHILRRAKPLRKT